jgi:hypothetical protein
VSDTQFYVYGHFTKDTDEIFYVGKGKENRLNESLSRTPFWQNVAAKHGWYSKVLEECSSEEEAFALEIDLIKKYGRRDLGTGPLVNMTDGGEGLSGPCPPERRKKISDARKGKGGLKGDANVSRRPEVARKISAAKKGVPKSEEHKEKLAAALRGRKREAFTEEHKQHLSEARREWWRKRKASNV